MTNYSLLVAILSKHLIRLTIECRAYCLSACRSIARVSREGSEDLSSVSTLPHLMLVGNLEKLNPSWHN
jgi:hypothetical protein